MSRLWHFGISVLWLGLLVGPRLEAQVSPGPLAKAHSQLEGTLKCTQCHGPGKDAMPARCVACHKDIGWLAGKGRGLHGSPPVKGVSCASCHPDHAGLDFQLIKWTEGSALRFDHRKTGWPLQQRHARIECEKCHVKAFRVSPAAAMAPGGQSRWTGLEQTCTSCHQDEHRGALGERCTSCHDADRWTVTPGFRHDTTDYPLTGKHLEVTCKACHADAKLGLKKDAKGEPIPVYRPVPHQSCASCHQDVHQGSFGANCASCHSTKGFTEIGAAKGFDHARTRFPLRGKHLVVKCASCHQDFTSEAGRRPASGTCATCHKVDPHAGTATLAGKSVDCASCHRETGFAPGAFSIEQHAQTKYPLEGRHAQVRCGSCHTKDPPTSTKWGSARVVVRPPASRCVTCHQDQHGGQLATRTDQGDCAACHQMTGWKPSSFDRAAHGKTALPLDGRHAEVECRACHGEIRNGLRRLPNVGQAGAAKFLMKGIETTCIGCHLDPHRGTFEPSGRRPVPGGCLGCHSTTGFLPAIVDVARHQQFTFKLGGAHRAVACVACHRELNSEVATKRWPMLVVAGIQPRPSRFETPMDCVGCHQPQNPHGTQFATRKDAGRCDACHGDEGFAPASRFDHDRDAAFKLEGGHQKAGCRECHQTEPVPGQPPRVIYRPLSGRCEDCHATKKP